MSRDPKRQAGELPEHEDAEDERDRGDLVAEFDAHATASAARARRAVRSSAAHLDDQLAQALHERDEVRSEGHVDRARARERHERVVEDAPGPRAHHADAVGEIGGFAQVVRDEQDRGLLRQPQVLHDRPQLLARELIERAERLVEQQQVADRAPGRGRARRAASCRRRAARDTCRRSPRGRPAPAAPRRGRGTRPCACAELLAERRHDLQRQHDVVADRQPRQQRRVLKGHADANRLRAHLTPCDEDVAARRPDQVADHLQDRRLAAAARARPARRNRPRRSGARSRPGPAGARAASEGDRTLSNSTKRSRSCGALGWPRRHAGDWQPASGRCCAARAPASAWIRHRATVPARPLDERRSRCTKRPRTRVWIGTPVTVTPSKGVIFPRECSVARRCVLARERSTTAMSASAPGSIAPCSARGRTPSPGSRPTSHVVLEGHASLATSVSMSGICVSTPGKPQSTVHISCASFPRAHAARGPSRSVRRSICSASQIGPGCASRARAD